MPQGNYKPKIYNGYTYTEKRKEFKHSTKDSHQNRREESKKETKRTTKST